MAKILIIDDEKEFRDGVAETLGDLGHESVGTKSVRDALAVLDHTSFDLILIDFRMQDINGVEGMRLIREKLFAQTPPIIMITAYADSENTIAAMNLGAFDHLNKPVSRRDIQRVLDTALKVSAESDHHQNLTLNKKVSPPKLVGQSEAIRSVLKMVGRLSATDSSVLITGETGTGKEVIARALHENSVRKKGPFIAINCAAIPESLLESELFGHVKGSFTGATFDRKGSFQAAHGGTLLLDEIGDMDLSLQAKILRVLQESEVTAVGSYRPVKVDVRILAATHQNLRELVDERRFREDLYYRLNVIQLHLPPLRDRLDDIPELSRSFLERIAGSSKSLAEDAITKLQDYPWPGNIRELKNTLERAAIVATGSVIHAEDISLDQDARNLRLSPRTVRGWHDAIAELEKQLLREALDESGGNRSVAAKRLGIQRQLLYAKLKEHQIDFI